MTDKTLEQKLNTLIDTKTKIRTAIVQSGVPCDVNVKFNDYADLIRQISTLTPTTSDQDILQICDIFAEINTR